MAARSRFSTSTVIDSEYLVPWLSAEGLGLQPHQAAGEGLLLPVHLDPPGNLRSAGQSARASLLWQFPKGQRSLPFRLLLVCGALPQLSDCWDGTPTEGCVCLITRSWTSDPHRPRVMRSCSRGRRRSLDRGLCGPGIQLRKKLTPGRRGVAVADPPAGRMPARKH
jgi:hypothetical protein